MCFFTQWARGVLAEFVTVTQTLEGVSVWSKFREFSQPHTRYNEGMRERVFYCIIFDPCLSVPTVYNQGTALNGVLSDETTKTNKQTNK